MGETQSKYGHIYLQTEKPVYSAGEMVTGYAYMNILYPFPGQVVILKIKGKEVAEFYQYTQQLANLNNHHVGKRYFIHNQFVIYKTDTQINVGQYQIPFSFKLPENIPSSFSESEPGSELGCYKARIIYQIKIECIGINQKMKHTEELTVRELFTQQKVGNYETNARINQCCCCCPSGTSFIRCHLEKSFYQPFEIANIITEIDNTNCQLNINRIDATLVHRLILLSDSGIKFVYDQTISRNSFPGVQKRTAALRDNCRKTSINLSSQSQTKLIQPSATGRFVSSQYLLQVTGFAEGCQCCCGEKLQVTMPIQIISQPQNNFGVVQKPQYWAPQILQNYVLDLNDPRSIYNPKKAKPQQLQIQQYTETVLQPQMNQLAIQPYQQQQQVQLQQVQQQQLQLQQVQQQQLQFLQAQQQQLQLQQTQPQLYIQQQQQQQFYPQQQQQQYLQQQQLQLQPQFQQPQQQNVGVQVIRESQPNEIDKLNKDI